MTEHRPSCPPQVHRGGSFSLEPHTLPSGALMAAGCKFGTSDRSFQLGTTPLGRILNSGVLSTLVGVLVLDEMLQGSGGVKAA